MTGEDNPYRVQLKRPAVDVKRLEDGSLIMRCPYDLPTPAENIGVWLRKWADATPARPFLVKDDQELTYGDTLKQAQSISQNLVKRKLSASRPVMILSKNGIENAVLQLAAMDAGIPAVHINPAFSLTEKRFDIFKYIFDQVEPGLLFAADGEPFKNALRYGLENGAEAVIARDPAEKLKTTTFESLTSAWRKGAAKKAYTKVTPETIAKIHFTGSTIDEIKGIVTTQGTMCANQEALAAVFPIANATPPVIVDDAPWHRASGGNLVFNAILRNGGTLYIERFGLEKGQGAIDKESLPSPTHHITELMALYSLLPTLEVHPEIQEIFFKNLEVIWVVGGAITDEAHDRLQQMATRQTGHRLPVLSSYSALGTGAVNTGLYFASEQTGNIGLPVPGTFLKLATIPSDSDEDEDTFELSVKSVTTGANGPGLWRDGAVIDAETDEDGFFPVGDVVKLIDPMRPYLGIERSGRTSDA